MMKTEVGTMLKSLRYPTLPRALVLGKACLAFGRAGMLDGPNQESDVAVQHRAVLWPARTAPPLRSIKLLHQLRE